MDSGEAPRVTAIRRARRGRGLVVVLDDGREIAASEDACVEAGAAPGRVASDELLARLEAAQQRAAAHEAALRLLSYRARSEAELRRKLGVRGIAVEVVDGEVARLREAGLLDDEHFAQAWVEERARLSPRGSRLLRAELRGHGVRAETAAAATADVDDAEAALAVARRRARMLAGGDFQAFAAKVGGYLQRRGFGYEVARAAVRQAWAEAGGGEDDAVD